MVKHALIIGGTSIVGYQLAKLLLLEGNWKVTGIARRMKDYAKDIKGYNIITCDLLGSKEELRRNLESSVKDVTHVFFMTWIPRPSEEEQVRVNRDLFCNIIGLTADCSMSLQHVYLQTGSKYYGIHLGPKGGLETPCKEDDPRKGPNFYYALEDEVVKIAQERNLTWSVARPPCMLGFTVDTAMNFGISLAVYALVMKELGKPLIFPYGQKAFQCFRELADTKLVARFIYWLVDDQNPQNKNQAFNITNGDLYRMETLWEKVADYFGLEVQVTEDPNFNLKRFMTENKEVWDRVVDNNGLRKYDMNSLGTWDFMELILKRDWNECMTINKSLKYGWTERRDTLDILESFFDELGLMKVIPLATRTERERQDIKMKKKVGAKGITGGIERKLTTKTEVSRG